MIKNNLIRKQIVFITTLLFLGLGIFSSTGDIVENYVPVQVVNNYFVHISDVHFMGDGTFDWEDFQDDVLSWENSPKFVVCTGDLVEFGAGDLGALNFELFTDFLFGTPGEWYLDPDQTIPILFCPGNHDSRYWHQIPFSHDITNYISYIDPDFFTFNNMEIIGNHAIVSLHSGYDYFLDLDHMWLPEGDGLDTFFIDLISYSFDGLDGVYNDRDDSGYVKILLTHHPYINPNGYEGNMLDGVFVNNRDEFRQLCEHYDVDFLLSGHTHASGDDLMEWNLNGDPWAPDDGIRCIDGGSLGDDYTITNITVPLRSITAPPL